MKKGLLAGIIVATGLALAACGSKETDSASSGGWEKIDDGTAAATEAETSAGTDFATATDEDATEIQFGRLILEVPGYYSVEQDSDSSYMCEYNAGTEEGSLIIVGTVEASGMTETDFAGKKDALAESMAESTSGSDNDSLKLINSTSVEYMGMPGYSYDYEVTLEGVQASMDVDVFLNTDDDLLYAAIYIELGDYDRDTATDYGNMMRNAQWAEASAQTSRGSDFATSTEDSSASASGSSSNGSGVTPEIKEALDSYESIMNSYCDFMEKYQSASATDLVSMMGDYTRMLGEYSDAMTALSKIDENSLNSTDLAYYMEVTNRVTQRLLKVAQ